MHGHVSGIQNITLLSFRRISLLINTDDAINLNYHLIELLQLDYNDVVNIQI